MTFEEALKDWEIRKKMIQAQCESCWGEEAELALVALRKQIPMEPNYDEPTLEGTVAHCSMCGVVAIGNYCVNCGQKIRWY